MELETSSWLWSPAVIKPFEWSASLLLSGEVNPFAVVSVTGKFLWGGGADPTPNSPFSSVVGTGQSDVVLKYTGCRNSLPNAIPFDNTP